MKWALALAALALLGVPAVSRRLAGTPSSGTQMPSLRPLSTFSPWPISAPLTDRYTRWYEHHPREQPPPMESAPAELTRPRGPAGHPPHESRVR